ncbi:MAG: nucleotide exchange factor GrpE [Chloroflexota bacterium]
MNDDKTNGADTGASDDPEPADDAQTQEPQASAGGAAGPSSGGRFGIRRNRTRAEERIADLDTSPARLTAELDEMRTRAETAEAELADARIGWQRTAADFQNYRRRTEQERAELAAMASEGLLRKVLGIADDFDRAIAHAPTDAAAAAWVEGVTAIDRKLRMILESEGITPIEALGQPFDPRRHEAIIHEPTTDAPDGHVVKELQRGYELNGRVIRPALVAVADNTSTPPTSNPGAGSAPLN